MTGRHADAVYDLLTLAYARGRSLSDAERGSLRELLAGLADVGPTLDDAAAVGLAAWLTLTREEPGTCRALLDSFAVTYGATTPAPPAAAASLHADAADDPLCCDERMLRASEVSNAETGEPVYVCRRCARVV